MDGERRLLTDAAWGRLRPLLPPQKPRTGRPARDHREVLEAVLWVLRTGSPWRDLPAEFGPWHTAASRFYRWRDAGVLARVLGALQEAADRRGELDWLRQYADSTVVRAHQHAAGAKGGRRTRRSAGAAAGSRPSCT
jgi:transposase